MDEGARGPVAFRPCRDRLHGTLRTDVPQQEVTIGLEGFNRPRQVTLARGKEEMSALSFVSIEQEAPRIVSIEGTALTAEGKNHAIFKSLATRLREDEKTLFYYWEGTWPGKKRIGFFGKGEITLDSAQNAHGFFTVSALDDAGMREHLETRFFRATAEESSVMNGDDSVLRNATVVRQLQRRESLAFD